MKKSIICIIIILTVVLTGCVENQASSQNDVKETYLSRAQKYGYFSMLGVTWGMSFEECVQAMGLKEKDFKKEEEIDGSSKEILYITPVKIRDKDADFVLCFDEKDNKTGLKVIRIGFKEKVSTDFVEEEIKKYLKEQNLSYKRVTDWMLLSYVNEEKLTTIKDEKIKIRADELLHTIYPQFVEYEGLENSEPRTHALDAISLMHDPEDESYTTGLMIMGRYASLVDYADKEIYAKTSSDK